MVLAEYDETSERILVHTTPRQKDLIRQVPGASFSAKVGAWRLPLSWSSCIVLRGVFEDELDIGPKLVEWATKELTERVAPASAVRELTSLNNVPDAAGINPEILEVARSFDKLFPHQQADVAWLTLARQGLITNEQGTGKTGAAVHALRALYMLGHDPFPALIVSPNSVKLNWKREFKMWWPALTVNVVKGSATQRRKLLEEPAHVYVMNWEGLRSHSRLAPYGSIALRRCKECGGEDERVTPARCETHKRELNYLDFRTVIGDECHKIKSPHAKQSRAFWAATGDAPYRIGLSGTPIGNSPEDLWSILHWLDPKEWPSRNAFIDRWCLTSFNAFGAPSIIGLRPDRKEEFFKIANARVRRMPKSLVLDLPPIVRERRDIEMPPKQKKAYEQMRDQLVAELDGNMLTATTPLTKLTRLMQFSSAYAEVTPFVHDDGRPDITVKLTAPSNKVDAFLEDMDDFGDDSVVVFAVSRQLIDLLSAKLAEKGVAHGLITGAQSTDQRDRHVQDFQAGKTKFILCTIQAGGVGLTLTKARIAVFLQRSWSMIDNLQAEARVHRIGSEQHETVVLYDYVTVDTIEEPQIEAVKAKGSRLAEVTRDAELMKKWLLGKQEELADNDEDETA